MFISYIFDQNFQIQIHYWSNTNIYTDKIENIVKLIQRKTQYVIISIISSPYVSCFSFSGKLTLNTFTSRCWNTLKYKHMWLFFYHCAQSDIQCIKSGNEKAAVVTVAVQWWRWWRCSSGDEDCAVVAMMTVQW